MKYNLTFEEYMSLPIAKRFSSESINKTIFNIIEQKDDEVNKQIIEKNYLVYTTYDFLAHGLKLPSENERRRVIINMLKYFQVEEFMKALRDYEKIGTDVSDTLSLDTLIDMAKDIELHDMFEYIGEHITGLKYAVTDDGVYVVEYMN